MTIQEMAKLGGKASAKKRLKGMTKKQKSEHMSKIRLSKVQQKEVNQLGKDMVKNLNQNVLASLTRSKK